MKSLKERDRELVAASETASFAELGRRYGISRSRVQQIVKGQKIYQARPGYEVVTEWVYRYGRTNRASRVLTVLTDMEVKTVQEIQQLSKAELMDQYGFGSSCWEWLEQRRKRER